MGTYQVLWTTEYKAEQGGAMLQLCVRAPSMMEYHWSSMRMAKQVLLDPPVVRRGSIRSRTRLVEDPWRTQASTIMTLRACKLALQRIECRLASQT